MSTLKRELLLAAILKEIGNNNQQHDAAPERKKVPTPTLVH
jgi:hypothetical protein